MANYTPKLNLKMPLATEGYSVADQNGNMIILDSAVDGKVPKPLTGNGTNGQLLRTNGDGTTAWTTQGAPTDEQVSSAVEDWLDENVDPATGYVLDRTLSMSNAATPADITGSLKSAFAQEPLSEASIKNTQEYYNYFDKNHVRINKSVNSGTGAILDYPGWMISAFIHMDFTKTVYLRNTTHKYLYCYDINLSYLGRVQGGNSSDYNVLSTYPTTYYVIVTTASTDSNIVLSYLNSDTFKDYYYPVEKWIIDSPYLLGKNKEITDQIKPAEYTNFYNDNIVLVFKDIFGSNGIIHSSDSCNTSAEIRMDFTKPIIIKNSTYQYAYCYDAKTNYLGRVDLSNSANRILKNIYANIEYFRIVSLVSDKNIIVAYDTYSSYESMVCDPFGGYKKDPTLLSVATYNAGDYVGNGLEYGADDTILAYRNAIAKEKINVLAVQPDRSSAGEHQEMDITFELGDIAGGNGQDVPSTSYIRTGYIPVDSYSTITITRTGNEKLYVFTYDAGKNYNGNNIYGRPISASTDQIITFVAARCHAYIRILVNSSNTNYSCSVNPVGVDAAESIYGMFKYCQMSGYDAYQFLGFASDYKLNNVKEIAYTGEYTFTHPKFLVGEINVDGKPILIVSIHVEWRDNATRQAQFNQIKAYADNYPYAIIMGDFNPESYTDGVPNHALTYAEDLKIFTDDGYTAANAGYFGVFTTFVGTSEFPVFPCDNIVVSENIKIKSVKRVVESYMNDHCILKAELAIY